ncbi:MAG TPA: BON domain-containing protein [Polyangiaceae bacterium]
MRHLGILLVTSIVAAACASNTPPAASSDSVAQASNVPNKGPDFAPASSDGLATAPADPRRAPTQPAPNLNPPPANYGNNTAPSATASNGTWGNGADGSSGVTPANGNAAASPAPDNSRINQRDRNSAALTPMDQGTSAADRTMTQQIRQAVMRDKALSFSAKNVKIITVNGKVTLRGPVKTDAERAAIEADARGVAGSAQVDNQLEVSK